MALIAERYSRTVFRFCLRALRQRELAEDVHQQVFLEAARDISRFRAASSPRTWLFGIAHHRVLDAARVRARASSRHADADVDLLIDVQPASGELQVTLRRSLPKLRAPAAAALALRYHLGLSYREMAVAEGGSAEAHCARVARAVAELRRLALA